MATPRGDRARSEPTSSAGGRAPAGRPAAGGPQGGKGSAARRDEGRAAALGRLLAWRPTGGQVSRLALRGAYAALAIGAMTAVAEWGRRDGLDRTALARAVAEAPAGAVAPPKRPAEIQPARTLDQRGLQALVTGAAKAR